ncbi:MAG: ATP synthase subunit I [Methylacidiphilales bacterium]|nr:ATP synthase subunit I [Candidatus Methylacidiphilales bacterium]
MIINAQVWKYQCVVAAIATTVVLVISDSTYALAFGYGSGIVLLGQLSVWWVQNRTEQLKKQGIITDQTSEYKRMQWALFIKYITIIVLFVIAWKSEKLISHPLSIISGYMLMVISVMPIHYLIHKNTTKETTEDFGDSN